MLRRCSPPVPDTPDELTEPMPPRAAVTFRYECWRAVCTGALEGAGAYSLVVAIRHFNSAPLLKALLNSGFDGGKIAAPLFIAWIAGINRTATSLGSTVLFWGAMAGFLMAAAPSEWVLLAGCFGQTLASAFMIPLEAQVNQENYPARIRGRLFTRAMTIRAISAMAFSYCLGFALDLNLHSFHFLFLLFPAAMLAAAYCFRQVPSERVKLPKQSEPWRAVRYLRDDPLFGLVMLSWMAMGMPNLVLFSLRYEYLASPRQGLVLAAVQIVTITAVTPALAKIVSATIWGWLYDRFSLFALRAVANLGIAVGFLILYNSREMPMLIFGAFFTTLFTAGADVAWSLWPTKLAPPGRIIDYMAFHSMLSGFRGITAPLIAFQLAAFLPAIQIARVAAILLVASNVFIALEWAEFQRRKLPIGAVAEA